MLTCDLLEEYASLFQKNTSEDGYLPAGGRRKNYHQNERSAVSERVYEMDTVSFMRKIVVSTQLDRKNVQKPLSLKDREELARHESVIERGFQTFLEVGTALLTIRKKMLYRETHQNFEDYCRERFDMSRMHAHRQMRAVEVCALLPNGETPRPENEAQLRPLTLVPSEKAPSIWLKAVRKAAGKKITAALVQKVVNEWRSESASSGEFGKTQWQELCLKHLRIMRKHVLEQNPDKMLDEVERLRVLIQESLLNSGARQECNRD